MEAFKAGNGVISAWAVERIESGTNYPVVLQRLREAIWLHNSEAAIPAISILKNMELNSHSDPIANAFISAVAGGNEAVASAIGTLGDPALINRALPPLLELLTSKDKDDRCEAVRRLGRLGPEAKGAINPLIAALDDSRIEVRWAAEEALGNFGPEARSAIPKLLAVLPADGDDSQWHIKLVRAIQAIDLEAATRAGV